MSKGVVVNARNVVGWPPEKADANPLKYPVMTFREALLGRYDYDAYYQPCHVPGEGDAQPRYRKAAAAEANVQMTAVFVDYDLPGHRPWQSRDEERRTCKALYESAGHSGLPSPAVYSTSRGCRLAWPLAAPIKGNLAESWLSAFRAYIKPRVAAEPLIMDENAGGWNRLYRLPHVKRDGDYWVPGYLSLFSFEALHWMPVTPLEDEEIRKRHEAMGMPVLRSLSAKEWLHIPEAFRAQLQSRQPLFSEGGRNDGTLNKLLPQISGTISNYAAPDPEIIFQAMAPGVKAQGCEPTLERLWERVYTIATNDAENFGLADYFGATLERETYEALEAARREKERANLDGASAADVRRAEQAEKAAAKLVKKLDKTRAEAEAKAQRQKSVQNANTDPTRPWLVYTGDAREAYVLYSDGRYYPKPKDTISKYLELEHGQTFRTDKGGLLPFTQLFDRIGKDAHQCVTRYWLPGREEHYDAVQKTLYKTTPPAARSLRARYHDEVDKWLRVMCKRDEDYVRLVDWLAAFLKLDYPLAALFLCGPPATGKTMLCDALAGIFGAKVDYNVVVGGNFQHGLELSPVLVADDAMKMDKDIAIEAFKEIITSRRHEVNLKYKMPVIMEGCARVLLNGNGINALQLPASGNSDHNQAVIERLFFVEVDKAAQEFLAVRDTHDPPWVGNPADGPGLIAEHVLWLHENHQQVTEKGRLLVSGDLSSDWMARKAAASEGLDGAVLLALAKWADRPGGRVQGLGVDPETYPGLVLVNAESLRENWEDLTLDSKTPPSRRLSSAVGHLSVWAESRPLKIPGFRKRLRCHAVPIAAVLEAATLAGIGNEDDLLERLAGETTAKSPGGNRP